MEQLPMLGQVPDPVELLLADMVEECMIEIVANKDSSLFWTKFKDHMYETAILAFEQHYQELIEDLGSTPDAFDYFIRFIQRMLAKPYALEALKKIESCRVTLNSTPGLENIVMLSTDQKDQIKPICYMLAVYAPITMYRISALDPNKGEG